MNSKSKIITVVSSIFLITIIIIFVAIRGEVFETKQEILVKAFPADINDLFNEEYINLKYNISSIRSRDIKINGDNFTIGEDIYVCVKTGEDKYAVVTDVCLSPLENKLCMKGVLTGINNNTFDIDYNIDKQFIPRGTDFSGDLEAKIVIDKSGNAKIKSLLIGGKEIK